MGDDDFVGLQTAVGALAQAMETMQQAVQRVGAVFEAEMTRADTDLGDVWLYEENLRQGPQRIWVSETQKLNTQAVTQIQQRTRSWSAKSFFVGYMPALNPRALSAFGLRQRVATGVSWKTWVRLWRVEGEPLR